MTCVTVVCDVRHTPLAATRRLNALNDKAGSDRVGGSNQLLLLPGDAGAGALTPGIEGVAHLEFTRGVGFAASLLIQSG